MTRYRFVLAATVVALFATQPCVRGQSGHPPSPATDDETDPGRAILFLSNEHTSWPTHQLVIQGFREAVQESPRPLALYQEFLDSSRFPRDQYAQGFRRWLMEKYRGRKIDLVVASGQEVVEFLASGNPWPGSAVLYSDVGALTIDVSQSLPGARGLIFEDHFRAALAVIKTVLPDTKRVGLIHGASPGERSRFHGFAEAVRAAELGLEPVDLTGLTMDDLLRRVAHLPDRTVLFLFSTQVDALGRSFHPMRACELVAAAANRPLFSLQAHELGCGITGGLLRDFKAAGRLLGERALLELDGQAMSDATVPIQRYSALAFDARQLERWHIDERRLPAGSILQFRQRSLLRDYSGLVIAASAIGGLQTVFIVWLLFEHRRRRRAEVETRQLLEEGRTHLLTIAHLDRRAAIGEVTAAITHELNQPLEAILHNAEAGELMLESGVTTDEEMRHIFADIRRIDMRASEIIQRLRSLLRKKEFETRPVDVNELTRDTATMVAPVASSKGVLLELDLATDVVPIVGDRVHLQQVLLNVLLNGIDAMSTTPRECRRLVVRTMTSDRHVEISVRDYGHGIRAEKVSKIFEPFYTTKGEGMGIGLAIARTIIEAHGGRIAARNNADGGATIWFTVPTCDPAAAPVTLNRASGLDLQAAVPGKAAARPTFMPS